MQKRKSLLAGIVILVYLLSYIVPSSAASGPNVMINNKMLSTNVAPVYSDGVVLVPAKEMAEALGGTFTSDRVTLSGTVRQGENELVFRLDNNTPKYNGKYIKSPAAMKLSGYRYLLPLEFSAKNMGAEVYMDTARNTILVFKPVDGKIVYEVRPGDTLWIISQLFGTSISSLRQLNNVTSDWLYVGQKLVIKYFTPFNTPIPALTSKNATVFSGPAFSSGVIGYLVSWTDISVVGKNGDWFKVTTPKGSGYLHYSVTYMKQDITDKAANSTYFNSTIPVDTSRDTVTFTQYTVQWGDSIWSLSLKYGIPDYELAQANGISPYAELSKGQILKVPVHNIAVKDKLGPQYGEVLDWFKEGQYVFPIGKTGKVTDIETGKSFNVKRTMGSNHSDTETLTAQDTQIMKDIFGGYWNWNRRAFILEIDGRQFAVSVAGMPHAGVDGAPYLKDVANRSDNWGYGPNYDSIAGNGMAGHFDLYFLNCLRHKDNLMDDAHQYRVLLAGGMQ